ncbi:hypothetical protein SHI21_15930 [Bacteriovorax sp. PP10]|uniref:Uncharacterized protein n=1 Tax=Bacteriovorax antarcticus TaxID=3088717 RepID=A0ABU5W1M1_9BACT|nr:hypothetical protein [Bacteriovorax sp. PP10]MEA9357720.1 hypothetical protein [Bacteriovorax sp. PP10]
MKFAIVMMTLLVSANVFAYSITDSTVLTSILPSISSASTTGGYPEALQVVNDAQEFLQSGAIHPKLAERINILQDNNSALSTGEAVDMLLARAEEIIKENE